jgi:hypothetical protein
MKSDDETTIEMRYRLSGVLRNGIAFPFDKIE